MIAYIAVVSVLSLGFILASVAGLVHLVRFALGCFRREEEKDWILKNKFLNGTLKISDFGSQFVQEEHLRGFEDCLEDCRGDCRGETEGQKSEDYEDAMSK